METKRYHEAVTVTREQESLEMGIIAQRINNVIKQEGLGVYNQDGIFDETTPYEMSHRMKYDTSELFVGWNGMKQAVMIDFTKIPNNNFSEVLREYAFDKKTIEMYEEEKSSFLYDSIAVHVDLIDGDVTWFEFIVNKSVKREKYIKLQIKHASYIVRLYYVEKSDPELDLKIISTKKGDVLEIRTNEDISTGAIEYFVKQINDEVTNKFGLLHNNPEYKCNWKSGVSSERIESTYQSVKRKEEEYNIRWNNIARERYINQIKTEIKKTNKPLSLSDIRSAVKNFKGYYSRQSILCKVCHTNHFGGYKYYINNYQVFVCRYCYQEIKQIKPYAKVILTNMGGKR